MTTPADHLTHLRVARATVADNPHPVARALETKDWMPLIRLAEKSEPGLMTLLLAKLVGQIARGEI